MSPGTAGRESSGLSLDEAGQASSSNGFSPDDHTIFMGPRVRRLGYTGCPAHAGSEFSGKVMRVTGPYSNGAGGRRG